MKEEKSLSVADIVQRLTKLELCLHDFSHHKSEVIGHLNEIISDLSRFIQAQALNQARNSVDPELISNNSAHISGLSKLLERFSQLQNDFAQRRQAIERRHSYQLEALQNDFKARVIQANQEAEADQAETVVAIFHKHRMSTPANHHPFVSSLSSSLRCSKEDSTSDTPKHLSHLSQRKSSLPIAKVSCLPLLNRRKSTAARFAISSSTAYSYPVKSCADLDLLAIKSRLKQ